MTTSDINKIMAEDLESRNKIIHNIKENYFVEAGAGSGKTKVLVDRMVAMVESGIDVKKICAITFTKAAANEFYQRFYNKLLERSKAPTINNYTPQIDELPQPNEESRHNCKKAIKDIDLCFMGTIDSFCNMLLNEHPVEAGVPASISVKDENEFLPIYKHEFIRISRGDYGEEIKQLCKKFSPFSWDPATDISEMIFKLIDKRDLSFKYQEVPSNSISVFTTLKREKDQIIGLLRLLTRDDVFQEAKYIKILKDGTIKEDSFTLLWNEIKDLTNKIDCDWENAYYKVRKALTELKSLRINKDLCFSKYPFGDYLDIIESEENKKGEIQYYVVNIFDKVLKAMAEEKYNVMMTIVDKSIQIISDNLKKSGNLSFFDCLLYVRNMLKEDAKNGGKLTEYIYNRHSYFLIDEFQDTNPLQAEVFFHLTAKEPKTRWKDCKPKDGSLFIVGDPKQSIYRFRSADVTSYLNVKSLFGKNVLYLTKNFRSVRKLHLMFNETFEKLMPEDTKIQSKFKTIPTDVNDNSEKGEELFEGLFSYNIQKGESEQESATILSIIKKLVKNDNKLITEKHKDGTVTKRKIEYGDFMILTKGKDALAPYAEKLGQEGIPFKIEGNVAFNKCPSLKLLSDVFSLIAEPQSKEAFYRLLTSQLFNMTDKYIINIRNEIITNKKFSFNILNYDTTDEILLKVKKICKLKKKLTPVSLALTILRELPILDIAGVYNLELLYYVIELLRSGENTGEIVTFFEAKEYIDNLILLNDKSQERSCEFSLDLNKVKLANLHKVKGLEAPIVILAHPSCSFATNPSFRADVESGRLWVFNINNCFSGDLYSEEKDEEIACLSAEKDRLLYVAATRAKNALIVSNLINEKGEQLKGAWVKLIEDNHPVLLTSEETSPAIRELKQIKDIIKPETIYLTHPSNEPTYKLVRPSLEKIYGKVSSKDEFEEVIRGDVSKKEIKTDANIKGSMVHRLMEILVSSIKVGTYNVDKICKEICNEFSYQVFYDDLVKVAQRIINGGFEQNNGMIADILSEVKSASFVSCEVPFCFKEGDTVNNGVIDLLYCKNNNWHIVDYKTNQEVNGLDKIYEGQLEVYKKALKKIENIDVNAKIYHIEV